MRVNAFSALLALGTLVTLAACTGGPGASAADAQAVQSLVGQPFTDATLAQALAAAGADEARMLRPDSMITKEYQVGRLNVVVGADNRITRVHCG